MDNFVFYLDGFKATKKSISLWFRKRWGHIVFWLGFVFYEVFFTYLAFDHAIRVFGYLIHYAVTISWFYFSANIILPWIILKDSKWIMLLKVLAAMVILMLSCVFFNYAVDFIVIHLKIMKSNGQSYNLKFITLLLYRHTYIFVISFGYFYFCHYTRQQRKSAQLMRQMLSNKIKQEKMQYALSKSNNDFLRAQINPHFLFNTLDYVYHNISIDSPDAAEAVLTLADMMRYAVSTNEEDDFVLLDDEIEQVEKLIYLYQLRKDNSLVVKSYFSEQARQIRFIPLILLTLVENIFKHGNVSDVEHGVVIETFLEEECLVIKTVNALNLVRARRSSNSGLRNITDRLEFSYGQNVVFNYGLQGELFVAEVRVPLQAIIAQEDRRLLLTPHFN